MRRRSSRPASRQRVLRPDFLLILTLVGGLIAGPAIAGEATAGEAETAAAQDESAEQSSEQPVILDKITVTAQKVPTPPHQSSKSSASYPFAILS